MLFYQDLANALIVLSEWKAGELQKFPIFNRLFIKLIQGT
ncbi:4'-phosphopantetheinyl transferase [Actinobacillus equuli]|nr:4'-phosphopantetheinyl transferase [Actinobacillus equuli]